MACSAVNPVAVGARAAASECLLHVAWCIRKRRRPTNLSFLSGPPRVPPKQDCCQKSGCPAIVPPVTAVLVSWSIEFVFLFWLYHSPVPCQLFVAGLR